MFFMVLERNNFGKQQPDHLLFLPASDFVLRSEERDRDTQTYSGHIVLQDGWRVYSARQS